MYPLLHGGIELRGLCRIGTLCMFDQCIDLGRAIAAAVGTAGRHRFTVKRIAQDIGCIHSHPGQAVHLEATGLDVAKERAPLVAADLQIDTHGRQLTLQYVRDPQTKGIGRCLVAECQWMLFIVARTPQVVARALWVVTVCGQIAHSGPMLRTQH